MPTFVEVKRSSDTRIRREVVGQMLDYAANAKVYWPEHRIREFAAEASDGLDALEDSLCGFLGNNDGEADRPDTEVYWNAVDSHLRNGEVRLLFIADSIPTELRRVIKFINEHMPLVEVLGGEIRQYEGREVQALVPHMTGQTESARQKKFRVARVSRPRRSTTREEFLAKCSGTPRELFSELFERAEATGCKLVWNTLSCSLRFPLASGSLATLFTAYPAAEPWPEMPLFRLYFECFKGSEADAALRQALLNRAPLVEKGRYTLEVPLGEEVSPAVAQAHPEVLKLVKEYAGREQ